MPECAAQHGELKRTHRGIQPQDYIGAGGEFEERLRELGKRLSEHTGSVEDFVEEHGLTSARAAFVVGVALKRLTGRA